uniref:Uncharacterized protein n=1 Tax=Cacopsylla melanoneura TaxID=428564 RepID=A0A8D8ULS1_9HEMI
MSNLQEKLQNFCAKSETEWRLLFPNMGDAVDNGLRANIFVHKYGCESFRNVNLNARLLVTSVEPQNSGYIRQSSSQSYCTTWKYGHYLKNRRRMISYLKSN